MHPITMGRRLMSYNVLLTMLSVSLVSGTCALAAPNTPKPATPDHQRTIQNVDIELHDEARRDMFQTRFVDGYRARIRAMSSGMRAMSASMDGGQLESASFAAAAGAPDRGSAVQSDVWVDGVTTHDGARLRYLADENQGLLVVRAGSQDRSPVFRRIPLGLTPKKLLIDAERKLLILIEEGSTRTGGKTQTFTNVVTFDISNPDHPNLVHSHTEAGVSAVDAFRVGKAIYIMGTRETDEPNAGYRHHSTPKKSVVLSYAVSEKANEIPFYAHRDEKLLDSKTTDNEPLSIVREVTPSGDIKYYAVAVTTATGAGCQPVVNNEIEHAVSSCSHVEILDISDAHGRIGSSTTIIAQGVIRRPGSISISGDQVIIASDVNSPSSGFAPRVSIEIFNFKSVTPQNSYAPTTAMTAAHHGFLMQAHQGRYSISENGTPIDLLSRIYGAQVQTSTGNVVSPLPITPDRQSFTSDNDNPIEILDIKIVTGHVVFSTADGKIVSFTYDPARGAGAVQFEGKVHVDGAAYRLFPINFQGRQFLLALGTYRKPHNNPRGIQQVRAQFYAVNENGVTPVGAPLDMPSNIKVDPNKPGLNYFTNIDSNGQGFISLEATILPTASDDHVAHHGAQILKLDVASATPSITMGKSLIGEGLTLTRFITGSPVAVGTDSHHVTFPGVTPDMLGSEIVDFSREHQQIIELSRDFQGTAQLGKSFVQIVKGPFHDSTLSLRLTDIASADAHLDQVAETLITGYYKAHAVVRDPVSGAPALLMQTYRHAASGDSSGQKTFEDLTLWVAHNGRLEQIAKQEIEVQPEPNYRHHEIFMGNGQEGTLEAATDAAAVQEELYVVSNFSQQTLFQVSNNRYLTLDRTGRKLVEIRLDASTEPGATTISKGNEVPIRGLNAALAKARMTFTDLVSPRAAEDSNVVWNVQVIGGRLVALMSVGLQLPAVDRLTPPQSSEEVEVVFSEDSARSFHGMSYKRNFIALLAPEADDSGAWHVVGEPINIPGRAVTFLADGTLVTEDTELLTGAVGVRDHDGVPSVHSVTTSHRYNGAVLSEGIATLIGSVEAPTGTSVLLPDGVAFIGGRSSTNEVLATTLQTRNTGSHSVFEAKRSTITGFHTAAVEGNSVEILGVTQAAGLTTTIPTENGMRQIPLNVVLVRTNGSAVYPIAFSPSGTAQVLPSSTPLVSGIVATGADRLPNRSLSPVTVGGGAVTWNHASIPDMDATHGNASSIFMIVGPSLCELNLTAPAAKRDAPTTARR